MEIDIKTLEAMLDTATIESELLPGHAFRIYTYTQSDGIQIVIEDIDKYKTILIISIPAKIKTTFSIGE
jgi:hypothetical protein